MRRFFIIFLLLFLSGCTYYAPPGESHESRVVTRIEVDAFREDQLQHFRYTSPEKMTAVLNYLRQLEPDLSASIAPDTFRTDAYRITLHLSDGQQRVYHQLYDAYMQDSGGTWRSIDSARGGSLPQLLKLLPSDPA